MTTGCAIVFTMEHVAKNSAISFVTIKNHTQWWKFAYENTCQLQRIIDAKMTNWKEYSNKDEEWFFNLRGYIWMRGRMYICKHNYNGVAESV